MKVYATLRTRCGCTKQVVVEGRYDRPPQEVKVAIQRGLEWHKLNPDPAALTHDVRVFELDRWHPATPHIEAEADYIER